MTGRVRASHLAGAAAGALFLGAAAAAAQQTDAVTLAVQQAQYEALEPKTVLELQPFRHTATATDAETGMRVTLISLNPAVAAWFLLQTRAGPDAAPESYHIENPDPAAQSLSLEAGPHPQLVIRARARTERCAPWRDGGAALADARGSGLPYAPLCDGRLFLRNRVTGARTNIEAAAEFLRDNVWKGEAIVRFVRDRFFKDAELETSRTLGAGTAGAIVPGPVPMRADRPAAELPVISTLLDFGLAGTPPGRMTLGQWYAVAGLDGVYASALQPRAIAPEVMAGPGAANPLDGVEAGATGYMIAFDMGRFDIGYAVGTDHPALGWSPRPPASARPRGMPGPDGIDTAKPLVTLGMVNPVIASRSVATFTGGFKREHGAFKFGEMAGYNLGHHYGFVEKGVILSKLQPGLSTLYALTDGTIGMKTWTEADNALLPRLRFARQNGVPLVEPDPETGAPRAGALVTKWGPGNWSGSAEGELRSLRAGACMAPAGDTEYLIYGYFSTATPSAMARSFQAYGCRYAMLLDMNALEHTYMALYVPRGGEVHVQHLMPGMALIEKKARDGTIIPRFIGFADNRDLFYITRKETQP